MMEAAVSSEMSVYFYQMTWCRIQKKAIFVVTAPEHLESPLTDVTVVIEGACKGQVMEIAFSFLFYHIY